MNHWTQLTLTRRELARKHPEWRVRNARSSDGCVPRAANQFRSRRVRGTDPHRFSPDDPGLHRVAVGMARALRPVRRCRSPELKFDDPLLDLVRSLRYAVSQRRTTLDGHTRTTPAGRPHHRPDLLRACAPVFKPRRVQSGTCQVAQDRLDRLP